MDSDTTQDRNNSNFHYWHTPNHWYTPNEDPQYLQSYNGTIPILIIGIHPMASCNKINGTIPILIIGIHPIAWYAPNQCIHTSTFG